MQAHAFSRTAQVMAFFRALESARPAVRRLIDDRFARTVLPPALRRLVGLARVPGVGSGICAVVDRRWPGARSSGVARTRLIDDWAAATVRDGARQVAILGAGFDSRAWRLAAVAGVPVFEVDHPATATEKRRRLIAAGLDPARVTQVAIDFARDGLAGALDAAGFDARRRSLVIWEGVSNYLSETAVDAVLHWVGGLAPGSRLAFTYVHAEVLKKPAAYAGAARILATVARAGEAWTYGIDPAVLADRLRAFGLTLLEDLGADEYRARYGGPSAARARGYAFYRAALVSVATHA